jgi:hypothetical protein
MRRRSAAVLVVTVAGVLLASSLAGQTLEGSAIQINTTKRGILPLASQVATAANGDFAVVWGEQNATTGDTRVWVRRFSSYGKPEGREVPVDPSSPKKQQVNPHIAMAAGGNFMIVWDLENHAFYADVAFGRCFAANGKALGPAFRLDPSGQNPTWRHPDIAAAPDGSFVATWGSDNAGILARRFAADGTPLGPAFSVASPVVYFQIYPRIAVRGNGDVLIAWLALGPADNLINILLMARRFDAEDHPLGDAFQVAQGLDSDYRFSMAMAEDGESLFAWLGFSSSGLLGQRCAADSTPLGEPFMISERDHDVNDLAPPAIAASPEGNYLVAWNGSTDMILGRTVSRDGGLPGPVLLIASNYPISIYPALSIARNGEGIVTWSDFFRRSSALLLHRFAPAP